MTREDTIAGLLALGIPLGVANDFPVLQVRAHGLLVYGSRARGDAVSDSDLDVLALVATPQPSTHSGHVNVSCYTVGQLTTGIGTLFGAHLSLNPPVFWGSSAW